MVDMWDRVHAWFSRAHDDCVRPSAVDSRHLIVARGARTCRVCYEDTVNLILLMKLDQHVCACRGLSEAVHPGCLRAWVGARARNNKFVCEICHAQYRPSAYADPHDERALRALLDAPFAPTAPDVDDAPFPQTATDDASQTWTSVIGIALFVVAWRVFNWCRRRALRRQITDILQHDTYMHPLYRRALVYAHKSDHAPTMQSAVDARLM